MSLNEEERKTLVSLYLNKAWATFVDAKNAINTESWSMAANRLYYSLFHATTALFVKDGIEVSTHHGIKAKLGENYIITGKMSSEYSHLLSKMETLRDKADYNIMFNASEKDVLPNLPLVEDFIKEIEKMINAAK